MASAPLLRVRFQTVAADAALPHDADAKLQRFLAYSRSIAQAGRLPRRHDIDPLQIVDILTAMFLLDVETDDFRFSLVGQDMAERYGNLKGRSVREIMSGPELEETLAEHRRCVASRLPVYVVNTRGTASRGDQQLFQRLLVPMTDGGEAITTLAGIVAFRSWQD